MSTEARLEPAVFLDLWQDKIFFGQEFLTWLWLHSEIEGNLIRVKNFGNVELWFESRLHLEQGDGGNKKSVTCLAPGAEWAEAHLALKEGKKLSKGRLKLRTEEKEWSFSLNADSLTPQSIKFPKTFTEGEEEEDSQAGRFLERAALLEELLSILTSIYDEFCQLRLSAQWLDEEVGSMSRWLAKKLS